MDLDRPPPMTDEYPAVAYRVGVYRSTLGLRVVAVLCHEMPDGTRREGFPLADDYVYEPGWLFRLLGDTLERRVARARARLVKQAEQEMIARRARLDAAYRAVTRA